MQFINIKRLIKSFHYAIQGIGYALKTQQNMRVHRLMMLLIICLGLFLKLTAIEWIFIFICCGLVIASELINTALETVVDLSTSDINFKAKIAKDCAAAAVLIFAIMSLVIGLIIFIPKIFKMFS